MNIKIIFLGLIIFSLIFANSASAADLPNAGIIPDSPFYFLKVWKESIQIFFTFGAENKAKQYLHLAEVRLAEYQKMIEKGKTEIAEKVLQKYEKQLNQAIDNASKLKQKGGDIADLSQKIQESVVKHIEVLQENLQKVPEQAKKGLENAIENSSKVIEKITEKKACTQEAKLCPDGSSVGRTGPNCEFAPCPGEEDGKICIQVITPAKNKETGECKEFPTPCDVPTGWTKVNSCSVPPAASWKTYQNKEYGFEVKHPPTLKIIENPQVAESHLFSVSFENPLADKTTEGQKIVFNISIFKDNKQLQDAFRLLILDDKGKVMVGGYEAQKLFSPKGRDISFTEATIYTIAAKNTSLIFYGSDFSEISKTDQNKILSSFKFTP